MSSLAFTGGCGTQESAPEAIPACSDVDWLSQRDIALLTATPTFSKLEIVPGESLSVQVPVNSTTRTVTVGVVPVVKLPGVGGNEDAETEGNEVVNVPIEDTNLPPGIYVARIVTLDGENGGELAVYISDRDANARYTLSTSTSTNLLNLCTTEMVAPTVVIRAER
jgi:hypothetical protein